MGPAMASELIDLDEKTAQKMAERILGTLIQTYLSPLMVDVLRNGIMADQNPKLRISFTANHLKRIECELIITPYDEPHAEAFPLQVTILSIRAGHALWRKLYAVINGSPVLNNRYIITDLSLDIHTGAVSFTM